MPVFSLNQRCYLINNVVTETKKVIDLLGMTAKKQSKLGQKKEIRFF